MDNISFGHKFAAQVTAPVYAFLYFTSQNRSLGLPISGLIKNLPLLFSLLALLLRWPAIWIVIGFVIFVMVRLFYWKAKRDGYIIFIPSSDQDRPTASEQIKDDQKVKICATGTFSVKDWEDYVVRRPADYWRVPIGDHALMVEPFQGQYLYQFIQPGAVEQIKSGLLCFGTHAEPALSITFLSTWGPESDDMDFMFYAPSKNNNPAKLRRKIFLSFHTQAIKDTVWYSLLRDVDQPIDEKL